MEHDSLEACVTEAKGTAPETINLDELNLKYNGRDIEVIIHEVEVGGIRFSDGGFKATFLKAYIGKSGKYLVSVYHHGQRCYNLDHIVLEHKVKTEARKVNKIQKKSGVHEIICIGHTEGQPCGEKRQVHAADLHLVKRCKKCQKIYATIKRRAKKGQHENKKT